MISRIKMAVGAGAIGLFLYACGGGGGGEAVVVAPPPARASLPLALMATVQDATSRQPLSLNANENITLVIYGTDADKIVDGEGRSLYNAAAKTAGPLTSSDGIFTIYVKPASSGAFAYNVRLVASARNFITSSQDLVLRDTDLNGDGSVRTIQVPISLISLAPSAQPDSVVSAKATGTLEAGGALTETIALSTPTSTSTVVVNGEPTVVTLGTAVANIPKSTVAYADDAKTKPLPAGTLSVDVVYNNNMTSDSLATFPGGFLTRQDPNGQPLPDPGGFISGGFASVEVASTAADGTVTKARTFDKPITLTISVPKGTVNPETGVEVKAGDVIPIWSYDTITGEWTVMKMTSTGAIITGTLGALGADNTFPVTFVTDHLSYFNLDWFYWKTTIPGKSTVAQCDTAPISIKGAQGRPLYLEATMVGGGWMHEFYLDGGKADPAVDKITYAPKNLKMRVDAYFGTNRADQSRLVGTVTVNDVCSGVSIDVTAGMARYIQSARSAALGVKVREVCSNDASKATDVPSDTVTAVSSGLPVVTAGTNSSGVATLPGLMVGRTYALTVKHRDGQTRKLNATIADTNAQVAVDFAIECRAVTGGSGG